MSTTLVEFKNLEVGDKFIVDKNTFVKIPLEQHGSCSCQDKNAVNAASGAKTKFSGKLKVHKINEQPGQLYT